MLLEPDDAQLFFRLSRTLLFFVNQQLKVIPDEISSPEEFSGLHPEVRVIVNSALVKNLHLIERFAVENPAHLAESELEIIRSWRNLVSGQFYIFRKLKNYTVFLSSTKSTVAYGVLALSQPFDELVGPYLPVLVQAVLLPFKDKIIYDGLLNTYRISFGPGVRRSLNEGFNEAKAQMGIVTSLPIAEKTRSQQSPVPKSKPRKKPSAPKLHPAEALEIITTMIEQFCHAHLNQEYSHVCRKLAEKLARKRPSPLLKGKLNAWAAGIVRAVGWVNFLSDRSQKPSMALREIDEYFGVSESTGTAKLSAIRKVLKIHQFDPDWTLPSRMDQNPMAWMIELNGFIVDVRHAPRDVQELAFEKGLIPYIPADPP